MAKKSESDEYLFYQSLFPDSLFVTDMPKKGVRPTFDVHCTVLKELFQKFKTEHYERFDFAVLNSVWESFISTNKAELPTLVGIESGQAKQKRFCGYEHDRKQYLATIETRTAVMWQNGKRIETKWLTVRLANNGFLYPMENEVPVRKSNVERGQSKDWCILDKQIVQKLPALFQFGKSYFTPTSLTLFYSYATDRIDVEMKDASLNGVQICFKRSYPTTDFTPGEFEFDEVFQKVK